MLSATTVSIVYAVISVVVAGAWILGYLDRYQKKAQNAALGAMGDTRLSYGLKSTIKSQEVTDDKDLNYLQGEVADNAGGIVGKGGVGEDIGETVSKSL
ncbi:MAG: hypothetical protein MMC23_007453 [Stictis urceolatum]|nr:hypothetical protein [Stictis urceolata]